MTLEEQVALVKTALEDKKAVDVKAYDVRGISGLADAFVVGTGTAAPHLKALVASTQAAMKDVGVNSYRTSGDPQSGWIVVDYVDVVVHVDELAHVGRQHIGLGAVDSAVMGLRQQRIEQLARLCKVLLFIIEHVDRDNDAEEEIRDPLEYGDSTGGQRRNQISAAACNINIKIV